MSSTSENVSPATHAQISGRIGRLRYMTWLCSIYLGIQLASISPPLWVVAILAGFVCYVGVSVKRIHDLGLSGWFVLVLGLPLVSLALLFLPGSRIANRYGEPPIRASRKEILIVAVVLTASVALLVATYILIVGPALARYSAANGL